MKNIYKVLILFVTVPTLASCSLMDNPTSSTTETVVHVSDVTISPQTVTMAVGEKNVLTATIFPSTATNKEISFSSSNSSVATVDSSGLVTGVSNGNAVITVTTADGGKTATCSVTVSGTTKGYKQIKSNELTATSKDYNKNYAYTIGVAKILVIPITLKDSSTGSWGTTELNNLNSYFFGNDICSFANYYKSVSHGKLTVSGMVTKPYSTDIPTSEILDDEQRFFDMLDAAISYAKSTYSSTNWSEYDLNEDGYFDSVHFLCNYNATIWGSNLWPHQYQTNRSKGTPSSPNLNVYTLSDLYRKGVKLSDSIVQIHEQGHVFGLSDYYSYTTGNKSDYVGRADMQDCDMFEWNSFSKLSVGWASPYVVDGTSNDFTLTMSSAALSEDCLVIPANYSTWNGSAFDEYFIVELFTNTGINNYFWNKYLTKYSDKNASLPSCGYGVRIYHVDARVSYSSGGDQINPQDWDLSKSTYIQGCNNSEIASDYSTHNEKWDDFALLQLVQATGTNTHSTKQYMCEDDLFKNGDTFNWDKANKFLRKDGTTVNTMDDGETFPWSIEFTAMSGSYVTMHITRK